MLDAKGWIDVLPKLLIEAYYTVKMWATELQSRVHEYVGYADRHFERLVPHQRQDRVNGDCVKAAV